MENAFVTKCIKFLFYFFRILKQMGIFWEWGILRERDTFPGNITGMGTRILKTKFSYTREWAIPGEWE